MQVNRIVAWGLLLFAGYASSQLRDADPDWRESEVPAPPAFEASRVIALDMPRHMSVKLGVDPETLRITPDGIVRYVMVAQSPGGTVNATYEGIRCLTGEVKVYARYTAAKVWTPVGNPEWRPLRNNQPSQHALAFARQGACEGRSAVASSPQGIIKKLKDSELQFQHK